MLKAIAVPRNHTGFGAGLKTGFRTGIAGLAYALMAACLVATPVSVSARQSTDHSGSSPIEMAELPPQARTTYALIKEGGPFAHDKDGAVFGNYERQLPKARRGYYREYTVKTPGARNRGARRIVCGGPVRTPDACYYTNDHYASFREIKE
jgi:ribonuclease T1